MSERRYNRFDRAFKLEAVKKSFEPGKTVAEVARELDIKVTLLYKWRAELDNKKNESTSIKVHSTVNEELEKLRREYTAPH